MSVTQWASPKKRKNKTTFQMEASLASKADNEPQQVSGNLLAEHFYDFAKTKHGI